ncbi:MAG: ribonuclease H-like domain-containing protein [Propionibacteriaceae bacterium]|jgi:hypothetical protein|nr:ribonuclease H-like domain-containing protein [Propionibacteriaceae bacterium]
MTSDFLLDPLALISCPVKVQNAVLYGEGDEVVVDHHGVSEFSQGQWPRQVIQALSDATGQKSGVGKCVDISLFPTSEERIEATTAAMAAGAALIIKAELPPTELLKGTADLLVRGGDNATGATGYHPVLIRDHPVLAHAPHHKGDLRVSFPGDFAHTVSLADYQFRWDRCAPDTMQLAHLWTLLEGCGHEAGADELGIAESSEAASPSLGIIIGNDDLEEYPHPLLVWVDLNDHQIRTFTSSLMASWRRRSPLNRFAHEAKFRVRVAATARAHALATVAEETPPLAVAPVRIPECKTCHWWSRCEPQLTDDLSVKIERAPLDAREITVLRSLGVRTVADLAATDLEALLPDYLPRVTHREGAEARLRLAAHRSRLLAEGVHLERLTTGPIDLPSADIEIDLDIESSAQDRVYLWGFLVHDRRPGGGQPMYHPVSRFDRLTHQGEIALANSAGTFLRDLLTGLGWSPKESNRRVRTQSRGGTGKAILNSARATGVPDATAKPTSPDQALGSDRTHLPDMTTTATSPDQIPSVLIWHYSSYELSAISRLASSQDRDASGLAWLHTVARPLFVDLYPLVKANFFGVEGLGLKKVATSGAGFSWRDPDPSGLNSQLWFADALQAKTEEERARAKERILEYNEDDVRATRALRHWLRSLT